jgi:hypothetical protein
MKLWEEITGRDSDGGMGWQHADLDYWNQSKNMSLAGCVIFKNQD